MMSSSWLMLLLAGLFEVIWSLGLKLTEGFTRPLPSVLTILAIIISMYLLSKSTEVLPIGTAYPIWVGIGALGAAIGGVVFFKETVSASKIIFICLLVISIVGLKFSSDH